MTTIVCNRCGLGDFQIPSYAPEAAMLKGEGVYCIPCFIVINGHDPTKPYPDAGGDEDAAAVLAGKACGCCYETLPASYANRSFEGTGLIRLCGECEDGLREAREIMDVADAAIGDADTPAVIGK